ncbi:MAG: M24 family metallopeptidase, partial [Muribaculaceae bacterium]|nr:M24 family metallopeptidase [Muribaculaceae bacterium]
VYSHIPSLYRPGMSDVELQIEIERVTRLEGGTGMFRVNGEDMELNNGSVLVGANADTPSPYDFAMGGRGCLPSLPVGADGTIIKPGNTVMVDTNGTFNAYMTDMTRTFVLGEAADSAVRAHRLSVEILRTLEKAACPGVPARDLYNIAVEMVAGAGLSDYFMGHRAKAGFIGHGVGIVINELPVIAPRSRDILAEGNVIAMEPKFVLPEIGAVGVENTYVVTASGLRRLTDAPEDLVNLDEL